MHSGPCPVYLVFLSLLLSPLAFCNASLYSSLFSFAIVERHSRLCTLARRLLRYRLSYPIQSNSEKGENSLKACWKMKCRLFSPPDWSSAGCLRGLSFFFFFQGKLSLVADVAFPFFFPISFRGWVFMNVLFSLRLVVLASRCRIRENKWRRYRI